MNFVTELIRTTIFILFPLSLFLIYLAYKNNLNLKEQRSIFTICVITSLYLIIKLDSNFNLYYMLLVNIPLIISYTKKNKYLSISLSVIIIVYYYLFLDINLYISILEYLFYYLYYYYFKRNKLSNEYVINSFVIVKAFILSSEIAIFNSLGYSIMAPLEIFVLLIVFYLLTIGIILLLNKGEEILNLNNILKELEKEKAIRSALFKVTHEVKNPISVCKGYLDMMPYDDIKSIKKYNGIIKKEIDRTLSIMDDFLDYTKIKIDPEIMDIYMLIEDVMSSMNIMFEYKNIKLTSIIPDEEVYVLGDYNRLKQVLVNILKNSYEAITKNGKIIIKCTSNSTTVNIKITDNGIGMSKETLAKVSEIFFTTKSNGTGLGVALSKEIINLHNGKIIYESTLNKGTEVTIKLPRKKLRNT